MLGTLALEPLKVIKMLLREPLSVMSRAMAGRGVTKGGPYSLSASASINFNIVVLDSY